MPKIMSLKLCLLLAILMPGASAFALDFSQYHSQFEIGQFLRETAAKFPETVSFISMGRSDNGREIVALRFTKSPLASPPVIYLNGTHHGNEKSSTESALAMIDYLQKNLDQPQIIELLNKYAIYIQPLVNPDGHALNRRTDANGVDPNRDYAFPSRSANESFQTQIIRVVRKLVDRLPVRAAVAFHSGEEAVLWPWGHTSQENPHQQEFRDLSRAAALSMGMERYLQSYFDYATEGEFTDYMYMQQRTLAVTLEVSDASTPQASELAAVVARSVKGTLAYINGVMNLDRQMMVASVQR